MNMCNMNMSFYGVCTLMSLCVRPPGIVFGLSSGLWFSHFVTFTFYLFKPLLCSFCCMLQVIVLLENICSFAEPIRCKSPPGFPCILLHTLYLHKTSRVCWEKASLQHYGEDGVFVAMCSVWCLPDGEKALFCYHQTKELLPVDFAVTHISLGKMYLT